MKINQRALIWGAILAAALIVLAVRVLPAVYVVLVLAVLTLVGLVAWSRMRGRSRDEDWEGGEEWGLSRDEDEDDYVDVNDRLAGLGLGLDTDEERSAERYDEEEPYEAGYGADEEPVGGAVYDRVGPSALDRRGQDLFAEAARYDLVVEGEGPAEAEADQYEVEYEYEDEDEYASYEEDELVEVIHARVQEEVDEILAAPGVIDEAKVDSAEAILAASNASSLQYEEVLTREDANAETREILSRVASLLAKYE